MSTYSLRYIHTDLSLSGKHVRPGTPKDKLMTYMVVISNSLIHRGSNLIVSGVNH